MTRVTRRNPTMTPAEVAFEYNVDPKTVARWAKAGKFPEGEAWIRTPGGHRRYIRAWIEAQLAGQAAPAPAAAAPSYISYLACGDTLTGPAGLDPGTPVHCEAHGVTTVTAWAAAGSQS